MAVSPFDYFKSASNSIDNEILSGKLPSGDLAVFPFLRCFASFEECVLFADEIQLHSGMPARYVYHSMHALIEPKRNRFSKWVRLKEPFDAKLVGHVMDLFEVGLRDAEDILEKLSEDGELEKLAESFEEPKAKQVRKKRK